MPRSSQAAAPGTGEETGRRSGTVVPAVAGSLATAWLLSAGSASPAPSFVGTSAGTSTVQVLHGKTMAPATAQLARPAAALRGVANKAAPAAQSSSSSGLLACGVSLALAGASAAGRSKRRRNCVQSRRGKVCAVRATTSTESPPDQYSEASEKSVRRKTRSVQIGALQIGSEHPIATQTMANTLTTDVEATVAQVKKCADMGIDIVRITVPGMREARACEHIKKRLLEDGYTTPLVADIHFTPKVAMIVADHVDKIRVNPGNFADGRKSFDTITELTADDIKAAQDAIEESLTPLVLKLKEKNKALRIGVNHGSMSERILLQYGDTPEGMVASAVEFGEICRKLDYHNFVFSMKSSNPKVMVGAYRALAREMYKRGWDYPLHLGVTEAGGGADGRIKSGVGIGALLMDGLGDTVRVSLTEDPELEAGPCLALRRAAEGAWGKGMDQPFHEGEARRQGRSERRACDFPVDVPLNADGSVLTRMTVEELRDMDVPSLCARLGLHLRGDGDVQKDWTSVDAVVVEGPICSSAAKKIRQLLDTPLGVVCEPGEHVPDGATVLYRRDSLRQPLPQRLGGHAVIFTGEESAEEVRTAMQLADPRFVLLQPKSTEGVTFLARRFFGLLDSLSLPTTVPVMLWLKTPKNETETENDVVVRGSAEFGSLFVDGLGEGILWDAEALSADMLRESSFNLLQAARMRISKTEFISCPSCGRTLFDLQETTTRIKERTGHLPGVRIAVMGCIVNGPGEMADADFGYVGSGVGKIDLYVGYNCVKRAIPSEDAVEGLVELIKEHGRWQDPPEAEPSDVGELVSNMA